MKSTPWLCWDTNKSWFFEPQRMMKALKKRANAGKVPTWRRPRSLVRSAYECGSRRQSAWLGVWFLPRLSATVVTSRISVRSRVRDMEADSRRRHKRMHLLDSDAEEHAIEFKDGVATAVICPKQGRRKITGWLNP
jgi:hypothetical protein